MNDVTNLSEIAQRYFDRFGPDVIPDTRRMPEHVLAKYPEMMQIALDRGTPLTEVELELFAPIGDGRERAI